MSLCCKIKLITLYVYEVLDKDTMKYEFLLHLFVAKRGKVVKGGRVEVIPCGFHKLKITC